MGCSDSFEDQSYGTSSSDMAASDGSQYLDPETPADMGINVFANQDVPSTPSPPSVVDAYGVNCADNEEVCEDEGINIFESQIASIAIDIPSLPSFTTTGSTPPLPTQTSTTTLTN